MDADVAMSRRDVETAVAASVPIIVSPLSHCYLDVPYAEPSADPGQAERQGRVGQQLYSPRTAAESFDWEPTESLGPGRATHVAGKKPQSGARRSPISTIVLPAVASARRSGPQSLERPAGRHLDRSPRSPRSARPTVGARRPHVLPHLHRALALAPICSGRKTREVLRSGLALARGRSQAVRAGEAHSGLLERAS